MTRHILENKNFELIKCTNVLKKIYGINSNLAISLIRFLGFDINILFKKLSFEDKLKIHKLLSVKFKKVVDVDLKKKNYDNIKQLKRIRSYKGIRHLLCLSVNGQRTKTNAKTQK